MTNRKLKLIPILIALLLLSSCTFFEPPKASLSVRDTGSEGKEAFQYSITIEGNDGTRQNITKLGSEISEPIPLTVNAEGGTITVNKIFKDGQTMIITSTGRVECKTIVNEIKVDLHHVGETDIDIAMTPGGAVASGGDAPSTFSMRTNKKGKAEFDKVTAVSGALDKDTYGTVIYEGRPTTKIENVIKTIAIESGAEQAASITYYLEYQGRLIDRITVDGSDYMKEERVKHDLDSDSLISYDINPDWYQDGDKLVIEWETDENILPILGDVTFLYEGSRFVAPYSKGGITLDVDESVEAMNVSYTVSYREWPTLLSSLHSFTHQRDKALRGIELRLSSPLKPGETVEYEIRHIPEDAEAVGAELLNLTPDIITIEPDKEDSRRGTITGIEEGTAELSYTRKNGKAINTFISVITQPQLTYKAEGRELEFFFTPEAGEGQEITLMRKVGSIIKPWREVADSSDIIDGKIARTEDSRRFPVWYKAVYTVKDGDAEPVDSTIIEINADDLLPPPPDVNGDIVITLPTISGPEFRLTQHLDAETQKVLFSLAETESLKDMTITWYLDESKLEGKGYDLEFDLEANKTSYTYQNTVIDENNKRTYFIEHITIIAEDSRGRLFSAEAEVSLDVSDHLVVGQE